MIYFKSCAKCGGDMSNKEGPYWDYLSCIQCGFDSDPINGSRKMKNSKNRNHDFANTQEFMTLMPVPNKPKSSLP